MKGLLLKDFYLTIKYSRFLLFFVLVYGVVGLFFSDGAVFVILPVMLIALLPQTLYSYDEREKWTVYTQALPISRAQYVTEKYLFGACCYAGYLALMAVLHLAAGTEDYGTLFVMQFTIGLMVPTILMPFLFRFGTEKGRMAYLLVIGALFGMSMALTKNSQGILSTLRRLTFPIWTLCPAMAAAYVLSWRLSITLYQKRTL